MIQRLRSVATKLRAGLVVLLVATFASVQVGQDLASSSSLFDVSDAGEGESPLPGGGEQGSTGDGEEDVDPEAGDDLDPALAVERPRIPSPDPTSRQPGSLIRALSLFVLDVPSPIPI